MKLKNLFYLLLALPLAFAACEETPEIQKPEEKPTFTLTSDATMDFEAAGGQGTITFVYDFTDKQEAEVNIECAANWVDVADKVQAYAASFTFTVAANEAEEAREAVVKASIGELYFEVTVKQAGKKEAPKTPEFNLTSEATMEFGQDSAIGTITFEIVNPVTGATVTAKSNQSWVNNITVREADGEIAFMVDANTGAAREAKITATYGMLEFKVTVKQAEYVAPAPEIIIDSANEEFEAEGGNGEIAFHVKNAVEGVEATATSAAEWLTVNSVANGVVNFTVAANETESVREGAITIAYGEVTSQVSVKQLFSGYNPGMEYSTFVVTEIFASSEEGGKMWEVVFIEHDVVLGDMQTRICFHMDEANAQRVSDGTYTVENGGILVNTSTMNGYSTYRANVTLATDITVANLTVKTDTNSKTIAINGTFQAANAVVTLNYNGEVRGMDLSEAVTGAINHTEWASVVKNWVENKELLFTATSADGSLKAVFDFYDYDSTKVLAEGEYPVSPYYDGIGMHLRASSYFTYNNVESELASGSATVEHIAGGYKITYNIIDQLGREFTGVIEGPIEGASNPA